MRGSFRCKICGETRDLNFQNLGERLHNETRPCAACAQKLRRKGTKWMKK